MTKLEKIDLENLPNHIGIIMDGNGRWAKSRFMPRIAGHKEGMNRVVDIVEECCRLNIGTLTLYAFSTENWKRPEEEVSGLMKILVVYINSQLKRLLENNIIFNIIGDYSKLPTQIVEMLDDAMKTTSKNTGMVLNIALNYGGRSEIINAIKRLNKDLTVGSFKIEDLNEENFKNYLYTKNSDADLIIRTGGEMRVSNFLIYQLAYSEFYFSETLWPDFNIDSLHTAILDFQNRNRRFGGI